MRMRMTMRMGMGVKMKVGVGGGVRLGVRMGMRVRVGNDVVGNEYFAHSINLPRPDRGRTRPDPDGPDERFER